MFIQSQLSRFSAILLTVLGVIACGPGRRPAKAPVPAEPADKSVVVCGKRLPITAEEASCVGAGVVELQGLRRLGRLTKFTLDDQSLPALWKLDDTTLSRLYELTIERVPVLDMGPFYLTKTPVVKSKAFARLGGLEALQLDVYLDDPRTLRSLTKLHTLKTSSNNLPHAEVVSEMGRLKELHVGRMPDLRPLQKHHSLEVLRGLAEQPGACELIERNPGLRELAVKPPALDCPSIARLPELRAITVFLPSDRAEADAAIVAVAKLERLRRVELFGSAATLRPLDSLPHLAELDSSLRDADIDEVSGLNSLERLTWHGPGNAERLAGMTRLRELRWEHYRSDWSRAPALPALETLQAHSYGEVAQLASSPRLREATLGTVQGDLGVLASLTELRTLSMELSQPQDLSPLATLHHLEKLELGWYDGSLSWLEGMAELREVSVTAPSPRIGTLPATLSLNRLEVRGAMGPTIALPALRVKTLILGPRHSVRWDEKPSRMTQRIESLSGIERVRGLEELVIERSSIRSLEPLKGLARLRRIEIAGARVASLEPLRGKPLQHLDIHGTRVSDLGPLGKSSRLRRLSLSGTAVDDLRPIARLPALALLDASSTPMSHVGQLAAMPSLYYLNISNTGVRDLSPLSAQTGLRYLDAPSSATHFVPLADLPLVGVLAPRFDCASKNAVPFAHLAAPPPCIERVEDEEDMPDSSASDDPFDEPWSQ